MSQLLDAFEEGIEHLRIAYEKYFLGVERQAPATKHQRVKAQMRQIEHLRPHSTALRFRFSALKARLVTYQHYWNRVLGQIEKGTYRRDLQQRVERRKRAATDPALFASASAPVGPSAAERGVPPRPPPPPVPGMKGAEVDRLFRELVRAKQAAGEDIQGLTVRALARKLSRELPRLQQRHGGQVRFEVATVGGKVRLRARSASDAR